MNGLLPRLALLTRNTRIRSAIFQAAIAIAVVLTGYWLAHNTVRNLAQRGITGGFGFLERAARFPISESILPYTSTDTFAWAFMVGLGNTLFASVLIIALATVLGLLLALARRGQNPLAAWIAGVFVETGRNTPLVVQLLFWYALLTLGLPHPQAALHPLPGVFLTDRGLYMPSFRLDGDAGHAAVFVAVVAAGLLALGVTALYARRRRFGNAGRATVFLAVLAVAILAATVSWTTGELALHLARPQLGRFNFAGGICLTPEFTAMLAGLVFYSAAFVGEIIRGGIDAVARGQWEAGRATGLSEAQTLRLIIAPQALRMIIPPMTSQYINIVKNTTLALVVGYPDIAFVTATTINQTGQAVEGIFLLMLVFLVISIGGSALMNWYNRRIALVER